MNKIIPLGTVLFNGEEEVTVSSVASFSGERYYFLTFDDQTVAMFPADVVEQYEAV